MELPPSLRVRYEPLAPLGRGGFGAVWRCRDRELDREVALKLLVLGDDPEVVARFQREARLTASLRHPHVVEVFDHGVADGTPWIAYALQEGQDLDAWRFVHGAPDPALLARWARQGAAALAAVHQAGLVHRDVKPANFLVRDQDQALVLVDFGIARAQDRAEGTLHTEEGVILGTPAFMAPELFLALPPSAASDQWAWAAVLAWLATGGTPYGAETPRRVMAAAPRFDPRGLALPSGVAPVLRRALDPRPERRFPDLPTMAAAMRDASWQASGGLGPLGAGGAPVTLPGMRTGPREGTTTRRIPTERRPVLAGGALALLVLGGVGGFLAGRPGPPPVPSEAPVTPAAPSEARLAELRGELDETERTLRAALTRDTQREPWNLEPAWEIPADAGSRYEVNRDWVRRTLLDNPVSNLWESFFLALGDLIEATERLDEAGQVRWLPEVYRGDQLVLLIQTMLGRGIGQSVHKADDIVDHGIAKGQLAQAMNDKKVIRATFLDMLAALERFARRLAELPEASARIQELHPWVSMVSRRGDVAAKVIAVLRSPPAENTEIRWLRLRTLLRMVLRDPRYLNWENEKALTIEGVCALIPVVLAEAPQQVEGLAHHSQRTEAWAYLIELEAESRSYCDAVAALPPDEAVGRARRAVAAVRTSLAVGMLGTEYLKGTAKALTEALRQLRERGDPAAAGLDEQLAELKRMLKA